jgi:hypothetical protein
MLCPSLYEVGPFYLCLYARPGWECCRARGQEKICSINPELNFSKDYQCLHCYLSSEPENTSEKQFQPSSRDKRNVIMPLRANSRRMADRLPGKHHQWVKTTTSWFKIDSCRALPELLALEIMALVGWCCLMSACLGIVCFISIVKWEHQRKINDSIYHQMFVELILYLRSACLCVLPRRPMKGRVCQTHRS